MDEELIPFQIRALDHLVLRVADLTRSLHFYVDGLGCTVEMRRDDIGLIQLRAGESIIDLVPLAGKLGRAGGAGPGKEGRNLDHFALEIALSMRRRSGRISPGAARRPVKAAGAMAPGDMDLRFISPIRMEMSSNSKARRNNQP